MKTKRKNDDERASGQERPVLLRQGMQYWWRRILPWSSCSLLAVFIVASAGFAQEVPPNLETSQVTKSQTPSIGGTVPVPSTGEQIYTDQDVVFYLHAPSPMWGNLFNEPIHETTKGGWFEVIAKNEYPSLSGNQIWLRVKPLGQIQDKCQTEAHGCWVYLGKRPTTDENPTWNFRMQKSWDIRVQK